MFSFKKIIDKDWYHRKWMIVLKIFLSKDKYEEYEIIEKAKTAYHQVFCEVLHLNRPQNLNEKLIWLSLFWRHPLKSICADKIKVRDYVVREKKLPEKLLVPLLGVFSKVEEINFDVLPDRFVIKCNHGCGYNILVSDKQQLNVKEIMVQLYQWMEEDYQGAVTEIHYKDINPHLIICEEFLPSLGEGQIIDYKIHCFNGVPDFVLVCYNRNEKGEAKLATFSLSWEQLFFVVDEQIVEIKRPESLNQMISYARVLSEDFPFVRVDFYDVKGSPILGELTFTPYGNMITYYKEDVLLSLGVKLSLPKKYLK